MANPPEGVNPGRVASASSEEVWTELDQVSTAMVLYHRLTPVIEQIEDVLLAAYAVKQRAGTLQATDSKQYSTYIEAARNVSIPAEEASANPHLYVRRAAGLMNLMLTEPALLADMFAGYTAISPGYDWSKYFNDAQLTDKWELLIVTALRLETEGKPRPTTLDTLVEAAKERDLYRYDNIV